jgi:hypothetical protein
VTRPFGGIIFEKGKFVVYLCSVHIAKPEGFECDAILETYNHELVHVADSRHCKKNKGPFDAFEKDACDQCLCDEIRAYWTSGQCSDRNSSWWTYHPHPEIPKTFESEFQCLAFSAAASCDCKEKTFKLTAERAEFLLKNKRCQEWAGQKRPFPTGPKDQAGPKTQAE